MKRLLILLLLTGGFAHAQIVNIPDLNFKARLLSAGTGNEIAKDLNGVYFKIDANNDGKIQESEALQVSYLNLNSLTAAKISDLTGIGYFMNLENLNCYSNHLAALNLGNLTNLKVLNCISNQLPSLDVSNLVHLQVLYCNDNQLPSLNVNNLINLQKLQCGDNQLLSLDVSNLANLQALHCYHNQISSLAVSNLTNLQYLSCENNQISALDVSNLANLQQVNCYSNQLTSLVLTGSVNLESVVCYGNHLVSLNLSGLSNLNHLNCGDNSLQSLDVSDLASIQTLYCYMNQLSSLDVSGLATLQGLSCSYNQLTSLDLSNSPALAKIYCDTNNLAYLNLKNGSIENEITFYGNPGLAYICADQAQMQTIQDMINAQIIFCSVSDYCSFTPGGNHNTITGTTSYDNENDGCDANDEVFEFLRLNLTGGGASGSTFTDASGDYNFYTGTGSFAIAPKLENPAYFLVSPASVPVSFANNNNNASTNNFCITPNGSHNDLEVIIVPIAPALPGFDAVYKIVYKNKGNQPLSGNIAFAYNDGLLDFVASSIAPFTMGTGALTYQYTDLLPFENRDFTITLNVNSPMETPAVNNGDLLIFNAVITPLPGDEIPGDNVFTYKQTVVGSYDPNEITCIEGINADPSQIGNYLHYVVNFENTGTAPAQSIVVKTDINPDQFDVATLQTINASHGVYTRIKENRVEFIFKDINLPAATGNPPVGGHGDVLFKIKTKSDLIEGATVQKVSQIYFDYNFPVSTSIAQTTFQALDNPVFEQDNSLKIYPNPAKAKVNINGDFNIRNIQLYDVQGRLLLALSENGTMATLDVSAYQNGVYFVKVATDKGSKVVQIIKE